MPVRISPDHLHNQTQSDAESKSPVLIHVLLSVKMGYILYATVFVLTMRSLCVVRAGMGVEDLDDVGSRRLRHLALDQVSVHSEQLIDFESDVALPGAHASQHGKVSK